MKKFLSIILSLSMVFAMSTTAFAAETETSTDEKIGRSAIENIYASKQTTLDRNATPKVMSNSDRDTFFSAIDEISELKAEKAWADEGVIAPLSNERITEIDQQIADLSNSIESLPVIKLNENDIATFGMKPTVPGDTAYVNFYGMTSYVTVNNKRYDVFEIVAYSDLSYSSTNRPMYAFEDALQLLGQGTYTQNQFCKAINFMFDTAVGATADKVIPGSSIAYSIIDPTRFFGTSMRKSLEMKYKANSYFCYAYVAESGINWFDFMQTTERLKLDSTITAYSPDYSISYAENEGVVRKVSYIEGQNWANVNLPATRYSNGDISRAGFPIGSKKIYRDNIHKDTIALQYYSSLDTIPGI